MPVLAFEPTSQQVHTPSFDGPLELLLYLIRRGGLDIRHVRIAPITDAYLQHLRTMQNLQLDIAGEFIVLATTLCYLKSCELLPQDKVEDNLEEDEDPIVIRQRLADQLLEYERYKIAGHRLGQLSQRDKDVFTKNIRDNTDTHTVDMHISSLDLLQLYQKILERQHAKEVVHHIEREEFSLHKMGEWLLDQFAYGMNTLQYCLQQFAWKSEKIICLLTVLELAKHHMIQIDQQGFLGMITIHPTYTERPSLTHIFTDSNG